MNARAAGAQPGQVGSRGIIEAAHVPNVKFQGDLFMVQGGAARQLQSLEIAGPEPALQGNTTDFSGTRDRDSSHLCRNEATYAPPGRGVVSGEKRPARDDECRASSSWREAWWV
jgi:hypothetical protein